MVRVSEGVTARQVAREKEVFITLKVILLFRMDHSGNSVFDRHLSPAQTDKGRLSVLYFLADV